MKKENTEKKTIETAGKRKKPEKKGEKKAELNDRVETILEALDRHYGKEAACGLQHETDWQLLFATMLSAQCTDKRVNLVTKDLFRKYPTLQSFADADLSELEEDIRSTGFYHHKAQNIKAAAGKLLEQYGGKMPQTIEELTGLPGVGRKTANIIRGLVFHEPSIVVDTHVKRISHLLGLTDTLDPVKAEFELMEILPEDHWILWNADLIDLGRKTCIANRPKCESCILKDFCPAS